MYKLISVAVLALALGAGGQAIAQSSGGGGSSGGGSSAGTAGSSGTGGGATTMPGMGNSGGTGTVTPGRNPTDPGTTGSTSTQNQSNGRPTQAECQAGWSSSMKWSQSEFKSLCGS
jgi:hypothetical protein